MCVMQIFVSHSLNLFCAMLHNMYALVSVLQAYMLGFSAIIFPTGCRCISNSWLLRPIGSTLWFVKASEVDMRDSVVSASI